MIYKALSVQQPYSYLILCGEKKIENRSKRTTHRGPVVIHAGSNRAKVRDYRKEYGEELLPEELFSYGCLIGVADLVAVEEMNADLEEDFWAGGPYCWTLENPRFFEEPIPSKGKLGVYRLTPEESKKVEERIHCAEKAAIAPGMKELVEIWKQEVDEEERLLGLVGCYAKLGKWEDQFRISSAGFNGFPENPNFPTDAGSSLCCKGKFEEALKYLNQAITIDPDFSWAYYFRGKARRDLGDPAGFLADMEKVQELDSGISIDGDLAFHIGLAYGKIDQKNNALKYFCEAIRLIPNKADAYFFRAIIRRDLGDVAGFEMDKKKAMELDPEVTEESFD